MRVDDVPAPFSTTYSDTAVTIEHGVTGVTFQALGDSGTPQPLSGGSVTAHYTGVVSLTLTNMQPQSPVAVWAFSSPTLLGTFRVPASGSGVIRVKLPQSIKPGSHTIVVKGTTPDSQQIDVRAGITVIDRVDAAPPSHPERPPLPAETLSYTGINTNRELSLALLLLLLGAGLVIASSARRRPFAWAWPARQRVGTESGTALRTDLALAPAAPASPAGYRAAAPELVEWEPDWQDTPSVLLPSAQLPEIDAEIVVDLVENSFVAHVTPRPGWMVAATVHADGKRSVSDAEWLALTTWIGSLETSSR